MATSTLLGRRLFLAAAANASRPQVQATSLRAASAVASQRTTRATSDENPNLLAKFGLLAAAGLAAGAAANSETNKAKCCGIAGVVGAKGDARDYLIEGLTILKNRGYDSAGIATMDDANPSLVSCEGVCAHHCYNT